MEFAFDAEKVCGIALTTSGGSETVTSTVRYRRLRIFGNIPVHPRGVGYGNSN